MACSSGSVANEGSGRSGLKIFLHRQRKEDRTRLEGAHSLPPPLRRHIRYNARREDTVSRLYIPCHNFRESFHPGRPWKISFLPRRSFLTRRRTFARFAKPSPISRELPTTQQLRRRIRLQRHPFPSRLFSICGFAYLSWKVQNLTEKKNINQQ